MIFGIGCDVCALDHLEKSLSGPHAAAEEVEAGRVGRIALYRVGRNRRRRS